MKNFHKIRGKREFLFDDRELIVLGGGALVMCGLIFVLGFLFGQGIQEKSVASPLDSKDALLTAETASIEKEVNATPVAESKPQETSASGKKSQTSSYKVLPDAETYVENVEATSTKKSTPGPASLEKSQPEKTEAKVSQRDVKAETPAPQQATPTALPRQEVTVAPVLPNVPKSPTDVIQVGRPTRAPEGKTTPTGGVYTVQVASSPNKGDSERLRQKYVDLGYEADIMPADIAGKGVWYRVLVGKLATKEEAEKFRKDLLSKVGQLANNPIILQVNE